MQPGQGHTTRYFYGKPSQLELDRLFGSEAGEASHYLKNMIVDANGQISVSYIDAHGRTIATALAGKSPDSVYALASSEEASAPFDEELVNRYNTTRSTADYTVTGNSTLLIPLTGTYHFKYSYDPATVVTSPCETDMKDLCSDGYYDLWITIKDECGDIKQEVKVAADISGIETSCDKQPPVVNGSFDTDLPIGEYQVTFQLRSSQAAAAYYDSAYLAQNTCILSEDDFKRNYIANIDLLSCFGNASPCAATLGSKEQFTARLLNLMQEHNLIPVSSDAVMAGNLYDSLLAKCQANTAISESPCAGSYLQMIADIEPGGQYGAYDQAALESNAANVFLERDINVLMHYNSITDYVNDNNLPDSVYNDSGELTSPKDLTESEFIRNWKPSWAASFLKFHPEYCYYRWCQLTASSRSFDARLEDLTTAQAARDAGFWDGSDPLLLLTKDAFFGSGGAGAGQYTLLHDKLQDFSHYIRDDAGLPVSNVLQVIKYIIYCAKDTSVQSFNDCSGPVDCAAGRDEDREWELYRNFYLQLKRPMLELARENSSIDTIRNCTNCYIGSGLVSSDPSLGSDYDEQNMVNGLVKTCPDNPLSASYAGKHRLFADDLQSQGLLQSLSAQSLERLSDSIALINQAALADNCHKNCEAQAIYWMAALKGCQELVTGSDSTKYKQLKAGLIQVCEKGCDMSHYLGSSTISPDSTNTDQSFEDVIIRVLGSEAVNSSCTALLINYPATYETQSLEYVTRDSCTCTKITNYYNQYKQTAYDVSTAGFLRWLQQKFGASFAIGVSELDMLLNKCVAGDCVSPSQLSFSLPYALTCSSCVSCDSVQHLVSDFQLLYPALSPDSANYETLLTNYLNGILHFNLSYGDYYQFIGRCGGSINNELINTISCNAFTKAYQQFSSLQPDYYANPNGVIGVADSFKVYLRDWMNIIFNRQLTYADYENIANGCNIALNVPHDSTAVTCEGEVIPSNPVQACIPGVMDCCGLDAYLSRFKSVFPVNANARLLAYYFRMQSGQWCAPSGIPVIDYHQPYADITSFYNHLSVPHDVVIDVVDSVATYINGSTASCNFPSYNFGDGGSGLAHADYVLCNSPVSVLVTPDSVPCMRTQLEMALINASLAYTVYRDSVLKDFQDIYLSKCLSVQPQMSVSGTLFEYHYTLYYYDQAGNLIKTVPPAGVKLLTDAQLYAVRQDRPYNIAECYQTTDTLNFNGTSAYIPYNSWLLDQSTQPYTIEVWANPSGGHDQGIFSDNVEVSAPSRFIDSTYTIPAFNGEKGLSCFTRGDQLVFRSGWQSPYSFPYPSFEQVEAVAGVPLSSLLPAGKWSHIVIEGTGNKLKPFSLIINGRAIPLIYQTQYTYLGGALTEEGPKQFRYGAALVAGDWRYFKGYTKQLRIYNRVMSYVEAWQNYNNACLMPRNDAGLKIWLPMNEGSGTVLRDIVNEQDVLLAGGPGYNWIRHHDPVLVKHDMPTTYQYNTLNAVVKQSTPDGGTSNFWYDRLGRLSVSQNAEQREPVNGGAANRYSYTLYDDIGRITEVGEKGGTDITAINTLDNTALSAWMTTGNRSQITKTFYDEQLNGLSILQTNLRKRVVSSITDEDGDGDYESATHYSYDVAGNVKTLWQYQEKMELAQAGQGTKQINYDYDLVSGKVNKVCYQPGLPDQFIYRYLYDADNRIVSAATSRDNLIWQQDASYKYYLHGPLARVEYGEHKVQGTDYAYTLQGWLKGVNSSRLDAGTDMGGDGESSSLHSEMGRDVYSFTLGYHGNDYQPIGTTATPAFDLGYQSPSALSSGNGLYNGNISFATTALSTISSGNTVGYSYGYDQLNRLTEMRYHDGLTGSGWNNASISDNYKEQIRYDANGNILTYLRNGNQAVNTAMDDLTYHYKDGTNQLSFISDDVAAGNYPQDIDNQAAGNYIYDRIGNLIQDRDAGITKIGWTVYGKIRQIIGRNALIYNYNAAGERISKLSGDSLTFYVRDATGNTLAIYKKSAGGFRWESQDLYGSSRLGTWEWGLAIPSRLMVPASSTDSLRDAYYLGQRIYEGANHLGNVLATFSDKKVGVSSDNNTVDYYQAVVISQHDYYPFGMLQPGRGYELGGYRYGFNGKENDGEVKGEGNQQDYGMRIYDPRLGRFLSVDPLTKSYPELTPYQFASNKPINSIDLDGLESWELSTPLHNLIQQVAKTDQIAVNQKLKVIQDLAMGQTSITQNARSPSYQMALNASADFEKEIAERAKLDPISYGGPGFGLGLARDPFIQASAMTVVPESGIVLGGLQTYYGVKEGDYVKASFGGLMMVGGVFGSGARYSPGSSAAQLAELESQAPGAHFLSRHGAGTTLSSQYRRAISGMTPEGEVLNMENSTRFLSDELQLEAVKLAQTEFTKTGKTSIILDMKKSIGEGFLKGGGNGSYRTTSTVQAYFKDGNLITLFPKIGR